MSSTASSVAAAAFAADPAPSPSHAQDRPAITRTAVAAAVAGNALEFYDFISYSFFAIYIGKAFFPVGSEIGSLLVSVATFGVGFFTRPLGGVLIGAFADRAGRKPAMILTVALITLGTLGLAMTPSYASIGLAAPVIVVLCRLMQGLALGGEVGPSSSLLIEAAPRHKRGLYASWQIASQGLAVLVAGILGAGLSAKLTPGELADWGWRVPFFLSLALIPIAVYIRRKLPETMEPSTEQSTGQLVGSVMTDHRRWVILGTLVMLASAVSAQVGNYMVTYAINTLKLNPTLSQVGTIVGGFTTFVSALIGGMLCDRLGRRGVMLWPRVLLAVLTVPLFQWLVASPSAYSLLFVNVVLSALASLSGAAILVAIPEILPSAVRSTGTSIIYAVGVTLFGGTAQFVITWLIAATGNPLSPAYYVVLTSIVSAVAISRMPETRGLEVSR